MLTYSLINRLTINFKHSNKIGRVEALPISQQYYEMHVYPAIEKVFDKYKNYDIRIENLKIDLNKIKIENISERISQLLEEQIRKYINIEKSSIITNIFTEKFAIKDKFQIFIHYLKYAEIPWYSNDANSFDIGNIVREIFIESKIEKMQLNEIINLISKNKIALQRFYYLVDDDILDKLLISVSNEEIKIIYNVITTAIVELHAEHKKEIRKYFFEIILSEIFIDKINIDKLIKNYTEIIIQKIQSSVLKKNIKTILEEKIKMALTATEYAEIIKSVMKIILEYYTGKTKSGKSIMFEEKENIPRTKTNNIVSKQENTKHKKTLLQSETMSGQEVEANAILNKIIYSDSVMETILEYYNRKTKSGKSIMFEEKENIKHKKTLLQSEIMSGQGVEANAILNKIISSNIYFDEEKRIKITNAGLVILNPMIKFLFDALGYLDTSGKFKSENSRFRAVHVLQSVTGLAGKHYEHLMPLNKIICGMNVRMSVDPEFKIKKNERDEINDLLKAVLQHWNVLKSTSAKGLQESFIQRKGAIEKSSKDWIVRVENTGIDLLLDDLPWSINILKYTWNDYIIHVEWKH